MSDIFDLDGDVVKPNTEKANDENFSDVPSGEDVKNDNKKNKATKKVSKPRVKAALLNTERLKGPKGIHTIERDFIGFKFKGKGMEKDDLDRVMKKLEHWTHRLYPKYDFQDSLARMEQIGSKKDLKVFITKYRMGMLDNDIVRNFEDDDVEPQSTENVPDPFDEIMEDQVFSIPEQVRELPQAPRPVPVLDDETKARIEQNRQLALERKREKQAQREAEKASSEVQGDEVPENQENVVSEEERMAKEKARIERNRQMALERKMAKMKERGALLQNLQDSSQAVQSEVAERNVNTESISMEVDPEAIVDSENV